MSHRSPPRRTYIMASPVHNPGAAPNARALTPSQAACRAAKRYAYQATCVVDIQGLGRATLRCDNISASGVFFGADFLLDEGTRLRCAIPLPQGGLWLVAGKVVRTDLGSEPGMAVAFDGITSFDRRRLDAAFSQRLDGAPSRRPSSATSRQQTRAANPA